ncbi:FtsK/SpoIIIE domain-containing protein, partial [Actinotalea sp. JY-7885]|uniref:FtsK/SpoIIIE domain-containing protein n=1 Tax=Actinotalea sp. JY-7885 TaxID=2758576 RepID=UPI00165E7B99
MWRISVRPSRESGLRPVDVVVDARPDARVADLAAALGEHLAGPTSGTLLAPVTDGAPWGADLLLTESDLRTGDMVEVAVVTREWLTRPAHRRRARAVARVVAGPDAGRQVRVEGDALTIGRAPTCTLVLTDPAVSRVHARVLLVGRPVVVDEGSAHGTRVGDVEVSRPQPAAWGERIVLGESVVVLEPADSSAPGGPAVSVLRPPRFGEPLVADEVEVPAPPAAPEPQPLPWPMMLMPVLLGGGMFAMSRSPFSLLFMIGFPVMMLATHLVQRRRQRADHAAELRVWRTEVDEVLVALDAAAELQRSHADEDEPRLDVLRARVRERHPSLWARQVDDPDFLRVGGGRGPRPAVVTASVARGGDRTQRELALREVGGRATLADLPVPVPLGDHGLVAVTGPRDDVDATVRALVLRLAAQHSPTDLTFAAVLGVDRTHVETWLRWLPHTGRRAGGAEPVAVGAGPGQHLLDLLVSEERGRARTVCLVDDAAGVPRRVLEAAAAQGTERGLHLVWLGPDPATVPAATGVVLDLAAGRLLRRDRGGVEEVRQADALPLVDAWRTARTMTAYQDDAAVVPADSAVPEQVRLPDLGADLADPDDVGAVLDRWAAARGLRAQIGAGADGVVTIDLREDGPHGLVAGTTGSGKSELLQTLLCSLALNNPPSRMTFLLVDYKGGAAFRECADLPHTVGYITDLTPALVQRALVSLQAELTTREHLLAAYGAKDLLAMERDHPEAAPPSMLICVDEFAALLAEVPEFVDGMVSIAQRGRSLGMHLLLATQRPAGVVTPQIKANTDLRIALRMASPEDSTDVIDTADAVRLSRRTPGRAWLRRTGHGTRELVQVAWVGAHEPVRDAAARVDVRPFAARDLGPFDAHDDGRAPGAPARVHAEADLGRLVRRS